MNDGEYLELVNDLKQQYTDMKERLGKQVAFLKQNNEDLKVLLRKAQPLRYATNQFCSPRPTGTIGIYSSKHRLHLYNCPVCSKPHPGGHHCG